MRLTTSTPPSGPPAPAAKNSAWLASPHRLPCRASSSGAAASGSFGASSSDSGGASGGTGSTPHPSPASAAPWSVTNYYTKKLERRTDSMGNIMSGPDSLAEAPGWTPDAQLRLAAEALAPSLHQDAGVLLEQVRQLQELLPGMGSALRRMKAAELVSMAAALEQITKQLIALRQRFPTADVAAMVAAHPPLLRMAPEQLDAAVAALQGAFPEASQDDVDAMLSCNAALLDGGASLACCLAGVGHLMTQQQLMRCLQRDPAFLYQFQPLEGQSRGERDAEYLADMYRPR